MKRSPAEELNGFIGEGMEVVGTVRFRRLLRVDGLLTGRVESYERLVVGQTGRVEADVIVGSLQVYGKVSGKIEVDEKVEIFPGARVEGELRAAAPALKISEGGVFDGELVMMPEKNKQSSLRKERDGRRESTLEGGGKQAGSEPDPA